MTKFLMHHWDMCRVKMILLLWVCNGLAPGKIVNMLTFHEARCYDKCIVLES
jgi:hypothetical protein